MQEELFHDETKRSAESILPGQSQTRSAQYARNYRKNPEKNRKINEDRRKNYKMKKEGINNVSSMFESAALPSKAEQQTIEQAVNKSDKPSLPDTGHQENSVCKGLEQSEILRQLSEIRGELSRQRDQILSIVKPATQPMPVDQEQASVSGIAITNGGNVTQEAAENQAKKSCSDNGFDDNVNMPKSSFLSGIFKKLSNLDGGAFITNFPAALALGFCAYYACLFVAEQTIPLYESLKFPNPEMACYGAIGLAVGFSALSAISRAEIIKLITAVIIAYEVLIVWSGSQANQKDLASESLKSNPTHFSISETYDIAKTDYEQKKARYEDKNSEVYHNGWFKINHLDPAKIKMDEASVKLEAVELKLGERYQADWIHLVLKALYRLSAVALVMLLAKETIKRGVGALSFGGHQRQSV